MISFHRNVEMIKRCDKMNLYKEVKIISEISRETGVDVSFFYVYPTIFFLQQLYLHYIISCLFILLQKKTVILWIRRYQDEYLFCGFCCIVKDRFDHDS